MNPVEEAALARAKAGLVELLRRRRLRRAPGEPPIKLHALWLARALRVREGGSPDSRKRGIRVLARALRAEGHPIMSDLGGLWWGEYPADHRLHQRFRRRWALAHLAEESRDRRSPAAARAAGQAPLWPPGDTP